MTLAERFAAFLRRRADRLDPPPFVITDVVYRYVGTVHNGRVASLAIDGFVFEPVPRTYADAVEQIKREQERAIAANDLAAVMRIGKAFDTTITRRHRASVHKFPPSSPDAE